MAQRHFCNGCGRAVEDAQEMGRRQDRPEGEDLRSADERVLFHVVEAQRATLAGSTGTLGLAGEETVRGELCNSCWEILTEFVGDVQTTQETMTALLRPPSARALATA